MRLMWTPCNSKSSCLQGSWLWKLQWKSTRELFTYTLIGKLYFRGSWRCATRKSNSQIPTAQSIAIIAIKLTWKVHWKTLLQCPKICTASKVSWKLHFGTGVQNMIATCTFPPRQLRMKAAKNSVKQACKFGWAQGLQQFLGRFWTLHPFKISNRFIRMLHQSYQVLSRFKKSLLTPSGC